MNFKKYKGNIFGVELNAKESQILEDYCQEYFNKKKDEIKASYEKELAAFEKRKTQLAQDAAAIALHKEFGFGPERQVRFNFRFVEILNGLTDMMLSDMDDDSDMWYSKGHIDQLMRAALGPKYFAPWEVRYGEVALEDIDPSKVGTAYRDELNNIKSGGIE